MTIGEKIKAWRIMKGLTQQEAAYVLEVSVKTIHNWETGATTPPKMIEKVIK